MPYDPITDFAPISMLSSIPNLLVVHPSLPVKSVRDLIALAKARPGVLNYSSAAIGTATHLAAELFKAMARVNIVSVPYKGGAGAVTALIAGDVDMAFTVGVAVMPFIKSGRLKALAVTTLKPSALVPGLPTVSESVPGYESGATAAIFAPAGTPSAIIARLNREIVRTLNAPDIREKFINGGSEVVGNAPNELAATVRSDMAKWGKIIKDANIRAE
jgi:tripartite-type tricarboxylate transporter receptor subunit TctC